MRPFSFLSRIKNSNISKHARVYPFSVIKCSEVGDYTYISYSCVLNNCVIGKYCSIAKDVKIGLGIHPTNFISTSPIFYSPKNPLGVALVKDYTFIDTKKVIIGNDVWIGTNVVVLDGVTIGDGAVIGANSVVTKDVEPYTIVGGVPAKAIKPRFSESVIEIMRELEWWNLPIDTLRETSVLEIFSKELDENDFSKIYNIIKKLH